MELRHLNIQDKTSWDSLVKKSSCSGFMQSWAWSQFKENSGQKIYRLGLIDNHEIIGGATAYIVESSLGTSPLIVPQGPVLSWDNPINIEQALQLLLTELGIIAQEHHTPVLRVEPAISADLMAKFFPMAQRAPIDLIPTPSLLIDIDRPDEAILAGMKPKGRYNIKQASKRGVETVSGTSPEFIEEFYNLFELTCMRHRFTGENLDFFQDLVRCLSPEGMARVYLSRYRGVVTSAAIMIFYGRTATYLYGGSSPFLPQSMSSYDLHWTAIRDAREAGCCSYDFYGIAPDDNPLHPYVKFTAFKKKFGGRLSNNAGAQDVIFYEQLASLWLKQMETVAVN